MISSISYLILGLIGAWVVNYLSDVLPRHRKLVSPRCPDCQADVSWLFYFGLASCEECGRKPGWRYWAVAVCLPVLGTVLAQFPAPVFGTYGSILWLVYFSLIIVIDLEHRLILHPVSLVGAALGLAFGFQAHGLWNTLLGGAAGFGVMFLFYLLGELFVRFLSKRRGEEIQEVALGFGDVNLAGVIGLLLGWPGVIGGIFLAVLLGGLVSGIFLLTKLFQKEYQAYQALPYGPFLSVSVFLLIYLSGYMN